MVSLSFSAIEAAELFKSNSRYGDKIESIHVVDQDIIIKVKTGLPLYKIANISLKFIAFEKGVGTFEIDTNAVVNKIISSKLNSLNPDSIEMEKMKLMVDFNELIVHKIKGLKIKDIALQDGCFKVTTYNV